MYYKSAPFIDCRIDIRTMSTDFTALKEAYYDPARTGSAEQLKRRLGSQYTLAVIKEWIRQQTDLLDARAFGPAYRNGGYQYLFLSVDVFSRYAFCAPMKDKTDQQVASSVSRVCLQAEQLGFEIREMVSDNEPAFTSTVYRQHTSRKNGCSTSMQHRCVPRTLALHHHTFITHLHHLSGLQTVAPQVDTTTDAAVPVIMSALDRTMAMMSRLNWSAVS